MSVSKKVIILNDRIRKKVTYLINKFGTNDPLELARYLNIKVFFMPLGKIAGFYKYMKHNRCIYINSDIDDNAFLRVVAAHELGHAVFHMKENCTFMGAHTLLLTSRVERQANLFAARLLITEDLLHEYDGFTKEQFCDCTGYPQELLDLRLL